MNQYHNLKYDLDRAETCVCSVLVEHIETRDLYSLA